jgi:hypothetical protein
LIIISNAQQCKAQVVNNGAQACACNWSQIKHLCHLSDVKGCLALEKNQTKFSCFCISYLDIHVSKVTKFHKVGFFPNTNLLLEEEVAIVISHIETSCNLGLEVRFSINATIEPILENCLDTMK